MVGELALGDVGFGIDYPVTAADDDAARCVRRQIGCVMFGLEHHRLRFLVLPQTKIARVPQRSIIGHLGIADLGDQLGRSQWASRTSARGAWTVAAFCCSGAMTFIRRDSSAVSKPVPTLPA
jgi:hypothetical protein